MSTESASLPPEGVATPAHRPVRRLLWNIVLIAHATLAILWWWRQPAGFAVTDRHFWANTILPWVVVIAMLVARFPRGRRGRTVRPMILLALPILWLAAAITARVVFPITFQYLFIAPLIVGVLLGITWLIEHRRLIAQPMLLAVLPAVAIGAFLPFSQRARPPGTIPLNQHLPDLPANTQTGSSPRDHQLSPQVHVNLAEGTIWHNTGPYRLGVNPLLSFTSRSPDACWVLLALPRERQGPQRFLRAIHPDSNSLGLVFADDDLSILRISSSEDSRSVDVEAHSRVPRAIWSHLNSFTEIILTGHRRLFVSFSPCPDQRIEVKPMDYPRGRPERIAFLDRSDMFRIVEASSGEKGPFRQLAAGKLARSSALSMTFYDEQTPIYQLTFDDFAAQASTQPSPTAGWGARENAIEFRLEGDDPSSPAFILMTLASTSVGSGYDSVGHAPGTYRNRMKIEQLAPAPAE